MDLDVNKHPFFQKDGKYYFWDETEADSVGPFDTPDVMDYPEPPWDEMSEDDRLAAEVAIMRWVKYGENLTVEIDTVTGTCTPIEVE